MNILAFVFSFLVLAAPPGPAKSVHECISRYPQIDAALRRSEAQTGIPRATIWAIAWVETQCDPAARGKAGEAGMLQIMPRDQTRYPASWFGDRPLATELMDPFFSSREAGRILLKNKIRFCGGDLMCAVRVYNGGTSVCVRTGGRDGRAMLVFAQSNDPCARAWQYAQRVYEVSTMVK
jgi:hypothetical protein